MAEVEKDPDLSDFMGTARKRFAAAAEDEKDLRLKFVQDLKLASPDGDDQWDPVIKQQREMAGRPAMAFPRCHTFVQQVSNEARQNKPQVKFAPRLDADKDTAEVYEGLARFIQYESNAQIAYETAIEYSAGGSFGYYRFLTEYCEDPDYDDADEDSIPQDLKICPVMDPLTVYGILVPTCFNRKPPFAFVIKEMTKEEYKVLYGDTEMASLPWVEAEKRADGWVGSDTVRIAEYWWCEEIKVKGKRRPKCKVKFCKINGLEELPDTRTEWAGSEIPIVPVLGKQMIIEGKPRVSSVVRAQKAAQQLINYSKSRIAETLSNSPIAPYMVANGQIAGFENMWAQLNRNPTPYLVYNVIDVAGRPAPPPQRDVQEAPIQSLSALVAQEIDDMKATTGIYDASMGAQSNETSAKAIGARQQSANLTTMHFLDNLERSFRQAGKIIEEMIPKIYDTEREVTILGPNEESKIVTINAEHQDEAGKPHHYKIAGNRVPLVVTMGRAYDTKRMETVDFIQELIRSVPTLAPILGDILIKNTDMAGADEAAERLHKMLPPQLQDQDEPLPPQAQAQIAQLTQQMQVMHGQLAKFTLEREAKVLEHHGKMAQISAQAQADMALEDKKLLTAVTVAEINTKAQNAADREADRRELEAQFHTQAHEVALQAMQGQQDQQMAAQQGAQQSQQSAQDAAQGQQATAQQAALQPQADAP
jgi:hypothetical protein